MNAATARRDGRAARWDSHRATRREELVNAALAAVREHGPAVAMDDVARVAGTSKTVVYRYFADKTALYLAVCERVTRTLVARLQAVLDEAGSEAEPGRRLLARAVDTYLAFVEDDPQVYRFVVHPPAIERPEDGDPVADLTALVGDQAGAVLARSLPGTDDAEALLWGHGLVGLVRAAGDHWVATGARTPREELTRSLTDLAWGGLSHRVRERSTR